VSLLALLATGAGTPIDPPDPVGVRAAIEAQLDPANYPGRVFTVGVDHATISGCLALADAASSATEWSLVRIPPGTYNERIIRGHATGWTDIASTTLNPADVIVDPPDDTDDALEHYGTGGIVAGITFKGKGTKSAVHSGEYSATVDYDFIYYKVVGTQADATGNDAFSWGVGPGQSVYAYDCEWHGITGGGRAVYIHNFPAAGLSRAGAAVVVFDGCTIDGAASGPASMSILEEDSDQADLIYVKGGTITATGIGYGYLSGTTTASWSGAVDAAHNYGTSVSPSSITRTLPAELPTPARLAAWLA
jgi:hypothetical protein